MRLITSPGSADFQLFFAQEGQHPARLVEALKPGEVQLWQREEGRDTALALAPEDAASARELGMAVAKLAAQVKATRLHLPRCLAPLALAHGVLSGGWQDRRFKSASSERPEVELSVEGLSTEEQDYLQALQVGRSLTREIVNAPGNQLQPASFARLIQSLAQESLRVQVWDHATIQARGMNLLAAVAGGGRDGARLVRLTVPAQGEVRRVIALVGKGITFDSGGYSIKTAQGMVTMKTDLGGAASVLGAVRAFSALPAARRPEGLEVRAYLALAENMVGPEAMRPGDIYRAANGKTVEVTNTDAEGRLILADTLSVACDEGAHEVIDLATLTGVKISALGNEIAGLFCNTPALTERIKTAAETAGEYVWELPLHQPYLKTYQQGTLADLKNTDLSPAGGSIKAALFLEQFVTRPWAHLDIAGNAAHEGHATGWGVGTLLEFLLESKAQ